jgi:hypothetical protein
LARLGIDLHDSDQSDKVVDHDPTVTDGEKGVAENVEHKQV